jgi:hypothetical protein
LPDLSVHPAKARLGGPMSGRVPELKVEEFKFIWSEIFKKDVFREPLNKSLFQRRIKYNLLIFMDSRLRGNDEF